MWTYVLYKYFMGCIRRGVDPCPPHYPILLGFGLSLSGPLGILIIFIFYFEQSKWCIRDEVFDEAI